VEADKKEGLKFMQRLIAKQKVRVAMFVNKGEIIDQQDHRAP